MSDAVYICVGCSTCLLANDGKSPFTEGCSDCWYPAKAGMPDCGRCGRQEDCPGCKGEGYQKAEVTTMTDERTMRSEQEAGVLISPQIAVAIGRCQGDLQRMMSNIDYCEKCPLIYVCVVGVHAEAALSEQLRTDTQEGDSGE